MMHPRKSVRDNLNHVHLLLIPSATGWVGARIQALSRRYVRYVNDRSWPPGGMQGSFRTLDGKAIPSTPATLEVHAGKRMIGYWCPDTITMDAPPTVTATFETGKSYVLHCAANQPAKVVEQ